MFFLAGISLVLLAGTFLVWSVLFQSFGSKAMESSIASVKESILPLNLATKPNPTYLNRWAEARKALVEAQENFLEVNFSSNKVIVYKAGVAISEAPIYAKGDPQGWGGTPAGLYSVLDMHKVAYSGIAEVNMPYAIHFYGKYYVHGETYYTSGIKTGDDVSGGCVQLLESDAAKVFAAAEPAMPVLVIDKENDSYSYEKISSGEPPLVSASSYLVTDLDSGFVFAEKNSQRVSSIASLTKLMTATVVAENIDLRKSVEVTPAMLEAYGETDALLLGERYRVVELFYPLLISSSNDAAEATAGFLGRERTIRMMNEKAEALLMQDTKFVDPSGLDSGNVSTAQDLFHLARYVVNNRPPIFEITKGEVVRTYGTISFAVQGLWNKNLFVEDTSFAGGKTGYTKAARHTGIFLFRFRAEQGALRTIAFVVLDSRNDKLDVQRLYGWLERNYNLKPDYEDTQLSNAS